MGAELAGIYADADRMGGFPAKVRLAGLIGITSTQASTVEDSAPLLERARAALRALEQELAGATADASAFQALRPARDATGALRRFNQIIADVLGQRSVFFAQPAESFSRLTEASAQGLAVARGSIWFYDERRTLIRCADLFERESRKHSAGVELPAKSFPRYFAALETQRTIAAHDAHQDPRTSEFSEPYLKPLGIGAMLDVPIWVDGKMVGVVCHEHLGGRREWTADDENFAYAMAGFVALAEERRRRR
ncbi:MAG: GAF domain-containing protein [Planctomycetota bacterium]